MALTTPAVSGRRRHAPVRAALAVLLVAAAPAPARAADGDAPGADPPPIDGRASLDAGVPAPGGRASLDAGVPAPGGRASLDAGSPPPADLHASPDAGPPPPHAPVGRSDAGGSRPNTRAAQDAAAPPDAGGPPPDTRAAHDAAAGGPHPDATARRGQTLIADTGPPLDAARRADAGPARPDTPAPPTRCALDLRPPMNALPCGLCHVEPPPAPVDCTRCHQQPPPHADLGACVDCHLPDRPFADAPFDHAARAGFALTGPHALRRCADCHPPSAPPARDACVACHADRHRGGAGQTCADCHTADTWLLVRFDHATTGFSLTGRHLGVPCVDCHPAGRFVGQPADCVFCHGEQLPRGHRFAGARDCAECHRPTTFSAPGFVHDPPVATGGVHARVATDCARCHTGAALDADDCARCHLRDLSAPHRAFLVDAGELLDCTRCHDRAAPWTANSFRHPLTLTGAHVGLPCGACHPLPPAIRAGAEACRGCHLADQPPRNHPAGRDCVDCHTTAAFYPAIFR